MISMVEHLQNLLNNPIVGHLGTRDENHKVFRTIFFSASVLENPTRLVLYIPEAGIAAARSNLLISNYAAALVVNAATYESLQIKGSVTMRPAAESEEAYYKKQMERLTEVHYPERIIHMAYKPLMALEIHILEIYNQTPGAGAGESMLFEKIEQGGIKPC